MQTAERRSAKLRDAKLRRSAYVTAVAYSHGGCRGGKCNISIYKKEKTPPLKSFLFFLINNSARP